MEINIFDYVDHNEIKEMVEAEVKNHLEDQVANAIRMEVREAVQKELGKVLAGSAELRGMMHVEIENAIDEAGFFGIFHRHQDEVSSSYQLLHDIVKEHEESLTERVKEIIDDLGYLDISDLIVGAVYKELQGRGQ